MKTIEEEKKYTIFLLLIFGATILVFIVLIILPIFQGIKKSSQDFIFQKTLLKMYEVRDKSFSSLQSLYQKYQSDIKKIDGLFVKTEMPVDFIEFLEENASSSSLKININLASPQKSKEFPWQSLGFRLSLSGSFPDFLKFLEKLESAPYLIKIISLDINNLLQEENKIKGNLLINVYAK